MGIYPTSLLVGFDTRLFLSGDYTRTETHAYQVQKNTYSDWHLPVGAPRIPSNKPSLRGQPPEVKFTKTSTCKNFKEKYNHPARMPGRRSGDAAAFKELLVWFYGISTIVGHLMPKSSLYIYIKYI